MTSPSKEVKTLTQPKAQTKGKKEEKHNKPQPSKPSQPDQPAQSTARTRRRVRAESITAKELQKCYVIQKAAGYYYDVRDKSSLIRSVADKIEEKSLAIGNKIISTKNGRRADRVLGPVCRTAHETAKKCINLAKKTRKSAVPEGASVFNLIIRYWPLTLFTRWFVDFTLGLCAATLALMKDISEFGKLTEEAAERDNRAHIEVVFSQYVPPNTPEPIVEDNGEEYEEMLEVVPEENEEFSQEGSVVSRGESQVSESNDTESRTNLDISTGYNVDIGLEWDGSTLFIGDNSLANCVLKIMEKPGVVVRFACCIFLPVITALTMLLYMVSNQLNRWAGIPETPEELKAREYLYDRLLEKDAKGDNRIDGNAQDPQNEAGQNQNEQQEGQDKKQPRESGQDKSGAANRLENAKKGEVEISKVETEESELADYDWLFDAVMDQQVGSLMKYYGVETIMDAVGIKRPVKISKEIATKLEERVKHLISTVQEKKRAIRRHLDSFSLDDETDDPDYQPEKQATEPPQDKNDSELQAESEASMVIDRARESKEPTHSETKNSASTNACSTPIENIGTKGSPTKQALEHENKFVFPETDLSPGVSPMAKSENDNCNGMGRESKTNGINTEERKKGIKVTVDIDENTKMENGFYVTDDLTDGVNGGSRMNGSLVDKLCITPETSNEKDNINTTRHAITVNIEEMTEADMMGNEVVPFEFSELARICREEINDALELVGFVENCTDGPGVESTDRLGDLPVDIGRPEDDTNRSSSNGSSLNISSPTGGRRRRISGSHAKTREFRESPGAECRDILDTEDGRQSSNVDTGQAVSGW